MKRRAFFGAVLGAASAPIVRTEAKPGRVISLETIRADQAQLRMGPGTTGIVPNGRLYGPSGMAHWYVEGDFRAPVKLVATSLPGCIAAYSYMRDGSEHWVSAAAYGHELGDFGFWRGGY